ncbi:MAG: hypothetical protein K8W52_10250 [Deltaproteobacteria bacterium]|nr:hypothetical protein [Deltaproteobacteria bacterium]
MHRPQLFAVMPGALMYRVEPSHGLGFAELDVARQVRCLASSAAFTRIPEPQLQALVESIAHAIGRADYHFQRFRMQRQRLDEIRAWAPGDVFFDAAVSTMHYELQALAGAARLLVDQLLSLIAKSHDQRDWEAVPIFRDLVVPGSSEDKPEIHRLRSHRDWFDLLNAYRNTFFHRGWAHGSGHFDSDGRQASEVPEMNALLVPDRASLTGRSRPYDWTYNDKTTVDDVGTGIYQGLNAMLADLCANAWTTAVPPPGRLAHDERPNIMVALPIPITLVIEDLLLAPIFSSRERAMAFVQLAPGLAEMVHAREAELLEVRSNSDLAPTPAISLSFARLTSDHATRTLMICLDPEPCDSGWSEFRSSSAVNVPLDELMRDNIRIASLPVDAPMTVYVWRKPFLIQ